MVTQDKDKENEAMQEQFLEDEAGVAELLELYTKVEGVYGSALEATKQDYVTCDTGSTNF